MKKLIGSSKAFRSAQQLAISAAKTNASVCLLGESGTGKELFARFIHEQSARKTQNFVAVNCGALSPNLIESLLFGHERGAFTGALERHIGFLEQAHGGTLFLDEIAELPIELQTRLLRVLEDGQVQRLGSRVSTRVDFRLICATHQDLQTLAQQQRFRADLFYRVFVLPVFLPPLRSRIEDITLLAEHFLHMLSAPIHCSISASALAALARYSWPGNIRELKNVLQRAVIMCRNHVITEKDLHFLALGKPINSYLKNLENQNLLHVLQKHRGNHTQTARELGIARSTLIARLKRHGISKENIFGKK